LGFEIALMPFPSARLVISAFFSVAALAAAVPPAALAQETKTDAVTKSPEAFRTDRFVPNSPKADDGAKPSGGVGVFERMGAKLPDLPPEKDYKGPVDEAYGAYQQGYYLTAMAKALPRAQLGDPAAQTLIGELLSQGLGVKRDTKGAAFWYGKAAEGGDAAAQFKYSLLLMEGGAVPRDKAKADEYMRKAAEGGNASAEFNWGQILIADNPGDKGLKLALPFYEKSAEQGIADAQYAVAQIYSTLQDLPDAKKQLAREWMLRAARAGFDTAELDLGIWLVNGVGGPRDYVKGFEWLKFAANRGNVVAQNKLAHLYINAIGTGPDPVEAAKWYVLSRRAGLTDPALEDFYLGIEESQQKAAIEAANKFRSL
jgi:TPR repeat protein